MFSEGLGCSKIFSKKICTAVHILGFVRSLTTVPHLQTVIQADACHMHFDGTFYSVESDVPLARVRSGSPWGTTPTPSFVDTLSMSGLISNEKKNQVKRMQKNCIGCSRAHRWCLFDSTHDVVCSRCQKFHLICTYCICAGINQEWDGDVGPG